MSSQPSIVWRKFLMNLSVNEIRILEYFMCTITQIYLLCLYFRVKTFF